MDWNIKIHGDKLEMEFADFISSEMSYYKQVWELYIGNNGTENEAKIADIPGLTENEAKKRIKFSEFHYTCLESIVCMNAIVEKSKEYSVESISKYINILNDYIAYGAHIGRLRDNLKMLWALLLNYDLSRIVPFYNLSNSEKRTMKNKLSSFEDYYEKRCIVVHGKKLPFSISENNKFLSVKAIKLNNSTFNANWLWNDMTNTDIADVSSYFEETFKDIVKIANDTILKEIHDEIKNTIMTGKQMERPIERNIDNYDTQISGSLNPII